ncbi:hypothetical protein ACFLZZ_00895 [Nanoarchaeota archaeon]
MVKPITGIVLEKLVTLAVINERFRNIEKSNLEHFHLSAEETQQSYLRQVEPILKPYAPHYKEIRMQMETREAIYQRQKNLKN